MWPDYCKKETLARRLDLEIGAVDQYVKRGLLPSPHKVGEALLFCWPGAGREARARRRGRARGRGI